MKASIKSSTCLSLAITPAFIAVLAFGGVPSADSLRFSPAYFTRANPPRLVLFPLDGPEATVVLPAVLPANLRVIAFASDGKTIYGQQTDPLQKSIGINRIELRPLGQSLVPGSVGMGEVRSLTVTQPSGRIVVAGWSWTLGEGGTFEIDPAAGSIRILRAGSEGVASPDGKRIIVSEGKEIRLLDLENGTVRVVKGIGGDARLAWSPNAQWISSIQNRRISLITANDPSRTRDLGASGDGPVEWSPDSTRLLVVTFPLSCRATLYGQSLEVVDIQTGKRSLVESSHCKVTSGSFGWIDRQALH